MSAQRSAGWLLTGIGMFGLRQVFVGRAPSIVTDTGELLSAAIRGDSTGVSSVSMRRGELSSGSGLSGDTSSEEVMYTGSKPVGGPTGQYSSLMNVGRKLATEVKNKYVWGAESKNEGGYDCSGFVWATLRAGGYNVGNTRFTTYSFPQLAKSRGFARQVSASDRQVGDIVLWRNHVGFYAGGDRLYSALSTKWGIRESSLSKSGQGDQPSYWRPVK